MKIARIGVLGVFAALIATAPVYGVGGEGSDDKPASTLDISYTLYAGGIPLGTAGMSLRIQGEDYKAISTLETKGIVTALWQAKIESASSGTIDSGRVRPGLYDSFSQNRQVARRHATLTYGADGPKTMISDPPYDGNTYPVTDAQRKNTVDPLSAVVYLTSSYTTDPRKPCEAVAPVFDGRRRYDVVFNFVRKTNVRMDNDIYSGPALVCEIRYNQIAGYQPSVIEQGKKFPKLFAWVVSAQSPTNPNHKYQLPIRVWAETEYGIVVAVATEVKLDGAPLAKSG